MAKGFYEFIKDHLKHLRPHTIPDAEKEADWNELARLFVQRFQEINNLPTDSLAGPSTFHTLEFLATLIKERGDG